MLRFARRRAARRRGEERGAALVELVLVATPLLIMILGLVEYGLMWSDSMALDRGSRSAARVASQLSNDARADREALRSLTADFGDSTRLDVQYVVLYEVTASGMDVNCERHSTTTCNHYTPDMLADLAVDTVWECGGGAHDRTWCPTTREAELHDPIDLGVLVVARRAGVTGMFGASSELRSTTVMRLNPIHR